MQPRPFYRLSELAIRWDCSFDDLIHLGITCKARICANLYAAIPEGCKIDYVDVTRPRDQPVPDDDPSFLRLQPLLEMSVGIYELVMFELRAIDAHGLPQPLGFAYQCDGYSWRACHFFGEMPLITERSLCMLAGEVKRLECDGFLAPMLAPDSQAQASFSKFVGTPSPKPRHRSDPLAVEIEAALLAFPEDQRPQRHALMAQLAKTAGAPGSCIVEAGPGYLLWRASDGELNRLDSEALRKRMRRTTTGR